MSKIDWNSQNIARLRKLSKKYIDAEIAQIMGLSKGYIALCRKKFGVPPYKPRGQAPFVWTDELIAQFNSLLKILP